MTFKELLDCVTFKDVAKGIIRYCRDKKSRVNKIFFDLCHQLAEVSFCFAIRIVKQ